jgi:predicted acetyltransferase
VLDNLAELYQHDFTEFDDRDDVGDDGRFGFDKLPLYWIEPGRHPFLVKVDGKYAGFALVREVSHFGADARVADMTEFFVMRKYRRKGVASHVARAVFDMFPGPWEVRVIHNNTPAQAFWRRIVGEYTSGAYTEREVNDERWNGPVLTFVAA